MKERPPCPRRLETRGPTTRAASVGAVAAAAPGTCAEGRVGFTTRPFVPLKVGIIGEHHGLTANVSICDVSFLGTHVEIDKEWKLFYNIFSFAHAS